MIMNLYILLLISLPEAFLNIILILLFAGKKEKLKLDKNNIMRFTIALVSMLLVSNFIRPIVPNVVINMLLHVIAYIVILKLVYNIDLKYITLGVLFMVLVLSSVENLYIPYIITYVSKGIENFSNHYPFYVVYSMPYRIFQIILIRFFWKHQVLLVTKINRRFHNFFIISTFILIIIEYFLNYLFYSYFNVMTLSHQISLSLSLILMVTVFNYLVFKFIYIAVSDIVTNGYKQYTELEENVKYALNEVEELLKMDKVDDAINLIDKLIGKDKIKLYKTEVKKYEV